MLKDIFLYYLLIINVVTFATYGIDKLKAIKNWWRIPEATLLILAAVGGSIGALLAMRVFHHKTLHKTFHYGVPAMLVVQLMLAALVFTAYIPE